MRRWWRRNPVTEDTTGEVDSSDGRLTVPWWERLITVVLCVIVGTFLLVTFATVMVPDAFPAWFGVQAVEVTNQDVRHYVPPKTLWDWFGLIAIPLSIVVVGYMLNRSDRSHERRLQDQQWLETRKIEARRIAESRNVEEGRIQEARELESQRIAENRKIEEDRLREARELEEDRAQDAIVKDYLDQMTELLLTRGLRTSLAGDEVRSVARARTLTALRGVDGVRKATIVQFLYEAQLIGYVHSDIEMADAAVQMYGTNLAGANLRGANLREAKLEGADLRKVKLEGAYLGTANLREANLAEVSLQGANLQWGNLEGANLSVSVLIEANLGRANLRGAKLSGVDLSRCEGLITDQLRQAKSLHRAILPDYINPADLGDLWSPPPETENTSEP